MKKYGITKGFTMPYFVAVNVAGERQTIEFALYQTYTRPQAGAQAPEPSLPRWSFGAPECLSPNGKSVLVLADMMTLEYPKLDRMLSPKEIAPFNNVYFCIGAGGKIEQPYNKMMETYDSKDPGMFHLRRMGFSSFGQLLVPFPDSTWDELALRITVNESAGYWLNFEDAPVEVLNEESAYAAFASAVMPTIVAAQEQASVDAYQATEVTFSTVPPRPGIRLYMKSDAGYLPKSELTTDDAGVVTVPVHALGMADGDKMTVEAGFKWVTNLARTQLNVRGPM